MKRARCYNDYQIYFMEHLYTCDEIDVVYYSEEEWYCNMFYLMRTLTSNEGVYFMCKEDKAPLGYPKYYIPNLSYREDMCVSNEWNYVTEIDCQYCILLTGLSNILDVEEQKEEFIKQIQKCKHNKEMDTSYCLIMSKCDECPYVKLL